MEIAVVAYGSFAMTEKGPRIMVDGVWIPACAGMTERGRDGRKTPRINLGAKYKMDYRKAVVRAASSAE